MIHGICHDAGTAKEGPSNPLNHSAFPNPSGPFGNLDDSEKTSPLPNSKLPKQAVILMLTPIYEGARQVCAPYWPRHVGDEISLPSDTSRYESEDDDDNYDDFEDGAGAGGLRGHHRNRSNSFGGIGSNYTNYGRDDYANENNYGSYGGGSSGSGNNNASNTTCSSSSTQEQSYRKVICLETKENTKPKTGFTKSKCATNDPYFYPHVYTKLQIETPGQAPIVVHHYYVDSWDDAKSPDDYRGGNSFFNKNDSYKDNSGYDDGSNSNDYDDHRDGNGDDEDYDTTPTPKFENLVCLIHTQLRQHDPNLSSGSAPLVLHCSAGVGRTGTFVVLDYVLCRWKMLEQYQRLSLRLSASGSGNSGDGDGGNGINCGGRGNNRLSNQSLESSLSALLTSDATDDETGNGIDPKTDTQNQPRTKTQLGTEPQPNTTGHTVVLPFDTIDPESFRPYMSPSSPDYDPIFVLVNMLRKQRVDMVQSFAQFDYVYKTVRRVVLEQGGVVRYGNGNGTGKRKDVSGNGSESGKVKVKVKYEAPKIAMSKSV